MMPGVVTIGVHAVRPPVRARVTLSSLLADRDASIRIKLGTFALAGLRAKRLLGSARNAGARFAVAVFAFLAVFLSRHALVLAGLTSFTVAAAQHSASAALVVGGAGAFFLELRRR
jgi:hypothetical protein